MIFAAYNLKGGVGKTATAVNLAYLSARDGYHVLLWDLDPQGAASFYFRVKPKVKGGVEKLVAGKLNLDRRIRETEFERLDLLPSDFSYRQMDLVLDDAKKPARRLRKLLKPLAKRYDHVFLDCPPGLSLLSENVFHAADVLLMPMIPSTLSMHTYGHIVRYLEEHPLKNLHVLPFFSMVDRRKKLHCAYCAEERGEDGLLDTVIPFASAVERMGVQRAPLLSYDRRSRAARAYEALWKEVLEKATGPARNRQI